MHIQKEAPEAHTILSYSDTEIKIGETLYTESFIVSRSNIITPWPVAGASALNEALLQTILDLKPEVIILGSNTPDVCQKLPAVQKLHAKNIGIECMTLGAASRTFNLLLTEERAVVAGMILSA